MRVNSGPAWTIYQYSDYKTKQNKTKGRREGKDVYCFELCYTPIRSSNSKYLIDIEGNVLGRNYY